MAHSSKLMRMYCISAYPILTKMEFCMSLLLEEIFSSNVSGVPLLQVCSRLQRASQRRTWSWDSKTTHACPLRLGACWGEWRVKESRRVRNALLSLKPPESFGGRSWWHCSHCVANPGTEVHDKSKSRSSHHRSLKNRPAIHICQVFCTSCLKSCKMIERQSQRCQIRLLR